SQIDLTPLVVQERRETGLYYQSYIITRNDSSIETLEDLEDKSFAFVDPGSTSGFVLPYALLKSRNIDIESYFSNIIYSGTHAQVPDDILSGKVEAGAISSVQFNILEADGKLVKDDFKIIWQSDNIPGSPYVARSDLDRGVKEGFIESMLNIHEEIPNDLHKFDESIEKFVEVDNNIYHSIRNIATILGKDYMYEYFLKGE
ncbi:periplasmic binding protein-like II, partial [Rhizophagus irregularis]